MAVAPRRVADSLFRRDMLGPSFGNLAASVTGLLLVEKLSMEWVLPAWSSDFEAMDASLGRLRFLMVGGLLVGTIGFWGFGTLFALPALFGAARWKIQPGRTLDIVALLQAMPLICLNFAISALVAPAVFMYLLPARAFDWKALPTAGTLARDVAVWLVVEEIMFFYMHRWLHVNKKMYAAVHKLHHTWTAPVSYVAIYCHPLEHLISNVAPLVAGPILCGSHIASVAVFIVVGFIHTTAVHSGYWICDDNGMHDEHHHKFNVNYGIMGLMDTWYGTYQLPRGAAGGDVPAAAASTDKRA